MFVSRGGVKWLGGGRTSRNTNSTRPTVSTPGDDPEGVDVGQHVGLASHQAVERQEGLAG